MNVVRFGVSLEKEMLEMLDDYMVQKKLTNRSQAIRNLITKVAVETKQRSDQVVGGSITLSYDHHKRELLENITNIQHDFHQLILCSQHIHVDHHQCMEIIALKGKASELETLYNELKIVKGVTHAELALIIV